MRKVFLEDLPRWENGRRGNEGTINWSECFGRDIKCIYNDLEYTISIEGYDVKTKRIKCRWNKNVIDIHVSNFIKCKLGKLFMKVTNEFKFEIGMLPKKNKNDTRELLIIDRKKEGCYKYYKIKCFKCGFNSGEYYRSGKLVEEYWVSEYHLKNGRGCPCCCEPSKIVVQGINDMYTTDYWMVELGVDEEFAKTHTSQSNEKVSCKCTDCEKIMHKMASAIYLTKTIGCSCGDNFSYLSKYIMATLKQLNLEFDTEVKYDWNKYINPRNNKLTQASIDFVIHYNNREIPLEADGGWHRKDNNLSGQTKEASEYIDKQRDENCLKYLGEETIRITDEGTIKDNVINSKLGELFDLSVVDWIKCEKFALKNIVKEVCDYWNDKEDCETTIIIAKLFNLNKTTTIEYLKQGTKLGWCKYNPEEEMKKNAYRNGKKNSKAINIFKDGDFIYTCVSATEFVKISQDIIGIKCTQSGISASILNNKDYKGFTFKYVD